MIPLKRYAWTAPVLVALALFPTAPAQAADTVRVGLILSLSGPAAAFGIPERDAIEIIGKMLNARDKLAGRKLEFVIFDDGTNPTEAARGVTQLAQGGQVQAIIGATIGSATLAMGPNAMRNKVPVVAPNATLSVTNSSNSFYPWIFRSTASDQTSTKVMFDKAVAAGAKRIAIFYQEDAYGKDTADYLQQLAAKAGITVVDMASAPLQAMDVTVQATRLRNAQPDAVLMQISQPALGGAFMRAAKQVGLKAAFWGGPGLGQRAFIEGAAGSAEGMNVVLMVNWDDQSASEKELAQLLTDGGKPPRGFGEIVASNAILVLAEAVKAVDGAVTGEKLRAALEKLCGVKTYVQGSGCYSPNNHDGWGEEMLSIAKIENGKFKRY